MFSSIGLSIKLIFLESSLPELVPIWAIFPPYLGFIIMVGILSPYLLGLISYFFYPRSSSWLVFLFCRVCPRIDFTESIVYNFTCVDMFLSYPEISIMSFKFHKIKFIYSIAQVLNIVWWFLYMYVPVYIQIKI